MPTQAIDFNDNSAWKLSLHDGVDMESWMTRRPPVWKVGRRAGSRFALGVLDAVAAFVLGFVEGLVGPGQEIGKRWRLGAAESSYAYAGSHRKRLAVDI